MEDTVEKTLEAISENTALSWIAVFFAAVAVAFIAKFVLGLASSRLRALTRKTSSAWDDVGLDLIDGLRGWVIWSWSFFLLSGPLDRTDGAHRFLQFLVVLSSSYQLGVWGLYLIRNWKTNFLEKRVATDPSVSSAVGLLYTTLRAIFLVVLALIALSNLGVNISALIAGLGIGGIAFALATQNVLGDLLASLSIVLDKPFVVGDFIVSGKELGTVEEIGIKTTRLRSLSGEQIILSNKDLLESRIQNFKRMWQRRVVQTFRVVYSTPPETLEEIPKWVKAIVEKTEKLKYDRCHLAAYGASSLDFELVFLVKDPDYNVYMDLQQEVLLETLKTFKRNGVEIAIPSQKLELAGLSQAPLKPDSLMPAMASAEP